jgi:mannan endo-1,4-beta-mannosidase
MSLGAPKTGNYTRLVTDLDKMVEIGLTNLRIMGSTQGPDDHAGRIVPSLEPKLGEYNEDQWEGLDIFLYEMGKRDMKAVIPLNNYWDWSGGFTAYLSWLTNGDIDDSAKFYTHK